MFACHFYRKMLATLLIHPALIPLDSYYHFKTRDLFAVLSKPVDVVASAQSVLEAHPDLFQKYRDNGYCTAIWQTTIQGYYDGVDGLQYDNDSAVDMIAANFAKAKWVEIAEESYTEQEVNDLEYDPDYAVMVYWLMVAAMALSWLISCCFWCFCIISRRKEWELRCCSDEGKYPSDSIGSLEVYGGDPVDDSRRDGHGSGRITYKL